jgi:hypothetical protein
MSWNPQQELLKKAHAIAIERHPDGFSNQQLVDASKAVYGGFGVVMAGNGLTSKEIKTMDDVRDMGNAMSEIDGRYPRGMGDCNVVGINGGCGHTCPVYLEGRCGEPDEMIPRLDGDQEIALHYDLYPKNNEGGKS